MDSHLNKIEIAAAKFRSRRFHSSSLVLDYQPLTKDRVDLAIKGYMVDGWELVGTLLLPSTKDGDLHLVLYFKHYCSTPLDGIGTCVLCSSEENTNPPSNPLLPTVTVKP